MDLREGETLGIVGESGSGKTVTCLSVLQLVPPPGRIVGGKILFENRNLVGLSEDELRQIRGKQIGMVFQDPMSSLNPFLTIGEQVAEPLQVHGGLSRRQTRSRTVEILEKVGIPEPASRLNEYPHRFSGGMRQRVMIAMALIGNPRVLIADEPTTALDVTIQAQVAGAVSQDQGGVRNRYPAHYPQPGGRGRNGRSRCGDVCRARGGIRSHGGVVLHPPPPVHAGPVARRAAPCRWLPPASGAHRPVIRRTSRNCLPDAPFYERCPFRQQQCREETPPLAPVGQEHLASCWVDVTEKR